MGEEFENTTNLPESESNYSGKATEKYFKSIFISLCYLRIHVSKLKQKLKYFLMEKALRKQQTILWGKRESSQLNQCLDTLSKGRDAKVELVYEYLDEIEDIFETLSVKRLSAGSFGESFTAPDGSVIKVARFFPSFFPLTLSS